MESKMSVLSGREFNEKYQGSKFVKLTNESENHNGYHFRTGLNVDTVAFNPRGSCQPGGIYFCEWEKLPMWIDYGAWIMVYARFVSIPEDAQVYEEGNKFKANKLMLGERQKIAELEIWNDREYCLRAWDLGNVLVYFQTAEICLAAVKRKGSVLQDVKNPTEEMCLAAVKQNGYALQYVQNQTEDICLAAVRKNCHALQYVQNQTEEICMEAVRRDFHALEYVRNQTEEICMSAVRHNGWALKYVQNQTEEICMEAVRRDGHALQYVQNQTEEICMAAVRHNGWALKYVLNRTEEMYMEAETKVICSRSYE